MIFLMYVLNCLMLIRIMYITPETFQPFMFIGCLVAGFNGYDLIIPWILMEAYSAYNKLK